MCGGEMNHHAFKVVYETAAATVAADDLAPGGVLHEAHACPSCGNVELRPVGPSSTASS
jgi:hypothetical protein